MTDCLNFGNPERPDVMGEFVGCVKGLGEACRALDFPVISGNVSLYNETNGKAVQPTPNIGGVGLIDDLDRMARIGFAGEGETVILIGETTGHLGSSLYLREIAGSEDGAPPPVDLAAERRTATLFARRFATAALPPATTFPTAACLSALPKWRLPRASDARSSLALKDCRRTPGCSAKTRRVMWLLPPMALTRCWPTPKRQAFRPASSRGQPVIR